MVDIEDFRKNKISIYIQNQRGMDETVEQMLVEHLGTDLTNLRELIYSNGLENVYLSSRFCIFEFLKNNIGSLSGGEAQRIHLLPVLLKKSDILILDEPTSDLDYDTKKELVDILQHMVDRIIIVVTHEEHLYERNASINIINI